MVVQIQENKKLFQWLLGGSSQKRVYHLVHETLKSAE